MKIVIRIILAALIILLLAFILFVKAVSNGNSVSEDAYESAKSIASTSANMVIYNDFYMYRGNESWDVIVGEDSEGNAIGVWIPVESTPDDEEPSEETSTEEQPAEEALQQGYILPMDAYLTEDEAIEAAIAGKDVAEVVSINLGMESEVVLWEVTCINSKGNYSYYYVNATTGEMIKSYENI